MLEVAPEVAEALAARRARSWRSSRRSSATGCRTRPTSRWRTRSSRSCATTARCRPRSPCSTASPTIGLSADTSSCSLTHPRCTRSPPATCRGCSRPGAHGATTVAARCGWPARPASGCSSPAASAACTVVRRDSSTSAPTSPRWLAVPVAVVSAGVKSILDIGLTLERMETLGVPVVGERQRRLPVVLLTHERIRGADAGRHPRGVAALMAATWGLGLGSGVSIANPIPAQDEIPPDEIDAVIEQALADCDAHGIHGKDVTPYLLGRSSSGPAAGPSRPTWPWCATTPWSARHRGRVRRARLSRTPVGARRPKISRCLTCPPAGYRGPS